MAAEAVTRDRDAAFDRDLIAVCRESAIAAMLRRVAADLRCAASTSRSWRMASAVVRGVVESSRSDQLRALGIGLLSAAAVHGALQISALGWPHWRLWVIPAVAAAQGAILIAMRGKSNV